MVDQLFIFLRLRRLIFFLLVVVLIKNIKMNDSDAFILGNIIQLTKSSEEKFKQRNFKGAMEDKIKANAILKSK